jgi:hypothetical protein
MTVSHFSGQLSEASPNEKVRVAGMITRFRSHLTKAGKQMGFVTLEDIQGNIELVLFPRTWEKYIGIIEPDRIVVIDGRLDLEGAEPKVLVDNISTDLSITTSIDPAPRPAAAAWGYGDPDVFLPEWPEPEPEPVDELPVALAAAVEPVSLPVEAGMPAATLQLGPAFELELPAAETGQIPEGLTSPAEEKTAGPEALVPAPVLSTPAALTVAAPTPPETQLAAGTANPEAEELEPWLEEDLIPLMDGQDYWGPGGPPPDEIFLARPARSKPAQKLPEAAPPAQDQPPSHPVPLPETHPTPVPVIHSAGEAPAEAEERTSGLPPFIISPHPAPAGENTHMITVIMRATGDKPRDVLRLRRIHGIVTSYPGSDRFAVHIFERNRGYLMEFPNLTTGLNPDLLSRLNFLVGSENVRVEKITFQ